MAIEANTYLTFTSIGNREDLADMIHDVSPTERPFMANAKTTRSIATLHEWQTDVLGAAVNNKEIEGNIATGDAIVPTVRVSNRLQIARAVISISGTLNAIDTAGRAEESAYQVIKAGRELTRDMEFTLTRNAASSVGSATVGRSLAGLESWLATNKTSVGTGTAQTTPGFASGDTVSPTDSTVLGAFTETSLKATIKLCFDNGGDPTMVMVNSFNKQTASGFAGNAAARRDTSDARITIVGAADLYISDFGQLALVPNRFQREETAFTLDFDFLAISFLRNIQMTPLSRTGDADRSMLITEYTLEVQNELASGKVTDLTTS